MTPNERIDRAQRAREANAFLEPILDEARAEYLAAMSRVAANEPWESAKITKLAIALKVIDLVGQHIKVAILEGEEAAKGLERARQIQELPEARRKWLR